MKISGILPTRGRPAMAARTLRGFLAQTHADKELVILDDSAEPSFEEAPDLPGVVYARSAERCIPLKRNSCCELATGEIITHFDSDDWSAPSRLAVQLQMMIESGKSVCGFSKMIFADEEHQLFGKYVKGIDDRYCVGTSLFYRRDWWKAHPFEFQMDIFEDNLFCRVAQGEIRSCDAGGLMVARVHSLNSTPKFMSRFQPISRQQVPEGFFQ